MFQAITPVNVHASIGAKLREFVVGRGLRPGDKLPSEYELAAALAVSRGTVREALRSLEALGMVEARHGKGRYLSEFNFNVITSSLAYSLSFDTTSARELLAIRRALEVAFLPEAAARLEAEDLEELRQVVKRMQARPKGTGTSNELAFHRTLFKRIENRILHQLLVIFWDLLAQIRASGRLGPTRAPGMADMHAAIVERLTEGQVGEAATILDRHFDDLANRLADLEQATGPPDA